MKRLALVYLMLVVAMSFALTGCSSDDPINAVLYDLIIDNQSSVDVDIYLDADLDDTGFASEGTVLAGQEMRIKDLVILVDYIMRGVEAGGDIEDFLAEQKFANNDPGKFDFKITITDP